MMRRFIHTSQPMAHDGLHHRIYHEPPFWQRPMGVATIAILSFVAGLVAGGVLL